MATQIALAASKEQISKRRNPVLDGWRGIAILLVLFEHLQHDLLHHLWVYTGQHGVTIFFVISGFLITGNLLREGSVKLTRFYVRRFFRLMPVAWAFLLFLVLTDWTFHKNFTSGPEILSCLTFWRNYFGIGNSAATTHFWSLSIEEQFYLIWPPLLVMLGKNRIRFVAVAGIAACSLWRYFHWGIYARFPWYFRTEVRADALLVGCLLAILVEHPQFLGFLDRFRVPMGIICLAVVGWSIWKFHNLPPTTECICIGLLIVSTARHGDRFKLLSNPVLVSIGVASYSLYVWQEFMIEMGFKRSESILLLLATPFVVYLSYRFIEKPMQALGRRVAS